MVLVCRENEQFVCLGLTDRQTDRQKGSALLLDFVLFLLLRTPTRLIQGENEEEEKQRSNRSEATAEEEEEVKKESFFRLAGILTQR